MATHHPPLDEKKAVRSMETAFPRLALKDLFLNFFLQTVDKQSRGKVLTNSNFHMGIR